MGSIDRRVELIDANGNALGIDEVTRAMIGIDYAHHEAHEGSAYFAIYSALKADAETIEMRIEAATSTKRAHVSISIDSALAATAEMWVPTTKTDASGNRITPYNRDEDSSNTSILTICHTPGGSQAGTANLIQYIGSASTGGRFVAAGATGTRGEFIFGSGSTRLIRVTSSSNNNALSIILSWYEKTPATS